MAMADEVPVHILAAAWLVFKHRNPRVKSELPPIGTLVMIRIRRRKVRGRKAGVEKCEDRPRDRSLRKLDRVEVKTALISLTERKDAIDGSQARFRRLAWQQNVDWLLQQGVSLCSEPGLALESGSSNVLE